MLSDQLMCNKKIMLHMNVENYPRHQTKLSCGQCGFELHIHFHHFWWHKWIIIETAAHFYTHTNIYIYTSLGHEHFSRFIFNLMCTLPLHFDVMTTTCSAYDFIIWTLNATCAVSLQAQLTNTHPNV